VAPQTILTHGLVAGLVGTAAMTAAEKLEQRLTRRPSSAVPAYTLERLLGRPRKPDGERLWMNWGMHWGQGTVFGVRSPPWSWPRDEPVVDLLHKGIYAVVTGLVVDRLSEGPRASARGPSTVGR
jgi:hypothetical protein